MILLVQLHLNKEPFFLRTTQYNINNIDEIRDFNTNYVRKISEKVKGRYEILNFCTLKCINNAKYSLILTLIDEGKADRIIRNLLLGKNLQYIGIDYKKLGEKSIKLNITFAKSS